MKFRRKKDTGMICTIVIYYKGMGLRHLLDIPPPPLSWQIFPQWVGYVFFGSDLFLDFQDIFDIYKRHS